MGEQEPPATGPRTLLVMVAVAVSVLVIVAALVVPVVVQRTRDTPVAVTLDAVAVYQDLRTDHVKRDVTYGQTPPVGGPHDPVWLDCGAYDAPVRDENAVHDLEHGAVWISYAPDLDAADVAELAAALPQNGIMAPYDGLRAPVVVTVWARQLALTGADDPRLGLFIAAYGDGHTAPEPLASCAGGVRETAGGGAAEV